MGKNAMKLRSSPSLKSQDAGTKACFDMIAKAWHTFLINAISDGVTHALEEDAQTKGMDVKVTEVSSDAIHLTVKLNRGASSLDFKITVTSSQDDNDG